MPSWRPSTTRRPAREHPAWELPVLSELSQAKGRSGVWPLELRRGVHDRSLAGGKGWLSGRATLYPGREVCEQLVLESQILTGKNYAGIWVPGTQLRFGGLGRLGAAAQAAGYGTTQLCTFRPGCQSYAPSGLMVDLSCMLAPRPAVYTIWGDVMVARASRNLKAGDEARFVAAVRSLLDCKHRQPQGYFRIYGPLASLGHAPREVHQRRGWRRLLVQAKESRKIMAGASTCGL